MGTGSRVSMAREAATKIVDTLSWTDYATVVTFGSAATGANSRLEKMTGTNKDTLKSWISTNVHSKGGGTNFEAAFDRAFSVLSGSASSSSGCEKVILFM